MKTLFKENLWVVYKHYFELLYRRKGRIYAVNIHTLLFRVVYLYRLLSWSCCRSLSHKGIFLFFAYVGRYRRVSLICENVYKKINPSARILSVRLGFESRCQIFSFQFSFKYFQAVFKLYHISFNATDFFMHFPR